MKKYLFFTYSDGDTYIKPLSSLRCLFSATDMLVFEFDHYDTEDDTSVDNDFDLVQINLKSGADEFAAIKEIADIITQHPHSDGIINIANDATKEYCFINDGVYIDLTSNALVGDSPT
tara:strand:- start:112 stop:465 length:354 start_codon:yes stop_codon:yes gene_type:complete